MLTYILVYINKFFGNVPILNDINLSFILYTLYTHFATFIPHNYFQSIFPFRLVRTEYETFPLFISFYLSHLNLFSPNISIYLSSFPFWEISRSITKMWYSMFLYVISPCNFHFCFSQRSVWKIILTPEYLIEKANYDIDFCKKISLLSLVQWFPDVFCVVMLLIFEKVPLFPKEIFQPQGNR